MLGLASLITLGIIFGFVFTVIFMIAYFAGFVDLPFVIGLTILVNALSWLLSPFFMDLMFRWFYRTRRVELADVRQRSKRVADRIQQTCEKYRLPIPKLRLIDDDNPTAFAFGSGAWNARLCFSEGLFTYLDEEEMEGVIAHELGHIRRRDFIIMTIAATAVQVLYELAELLMRRKSRSDNKKGDLLLIAGIIAYIFYIIGTYLLLFLSRTREYGADEFSAHETQNPDALSRALVKIAYGIIAKADDAHTKHLLNATRALGPYDTKAARHLGTAFQSTHGNWNAITPVLAYDLRSPWAKILELESTHPLTAKRIRALNGCAKKFGKNVSIDTDQALKIPVDSERLYRGFALGVLIHFLPWILPLAVLGFAGVQGDLNLAAFLPMSLGIGLLIQILYKYPDKEPQPGTALEMMSDIYASPVRGTPYTLEGTIIGRGTPGAVLAEDVMIQDKTGLIYLNYESAFAGIGNFIFALTKVQKLIGQEAAVAGWFFRDIGHHLDLQKMVSGEKTIQSHPKLWGLIVSFSLIAISVIIFFLALPR